MIIDQVSTIYDVAAFVAGLRTATRGVLRLTVATPDATQALSTAWLLTDSLVVVPDYVVSSRWTDRVSDFLCDVDGGDAKPIRATLIHQPAPTAEGKQAALLRLEQPLTKRALTLHIAALQTGDPVFLLQHPQGIRETKVSFGRLVAQTEDSLTYDADSENGSGGGPVFASDWSVVAMHSGAATATDQGSGKVNFGISLAAMLDGLRETSAWGEIAAHHGLANVSAASLDLASVAPAAKPVDDSAALAAAVRWTTDPTSLSEADRDHLRPLVIDPTATRWVLLGNERERLLRGATLDMLRDARGTGDESEPGQQTIDRILAGPPFALSEIPESLLPFWLQAVRWFADIVPQLPSPADIHKDLGRRRLRSRLEETAGPGFRGRTVELAELDEWFADPNAGPMALTGIGGIGKSALVAKLASSLPASTIQLWLDFDRADLAPDNAVSVLSLLFEQLALQVDGFVAPSYDLETWHQAIASLRAALPTTMKPDTPMLLVLDGFEVAQHKDRHLEIWELLEQLVDQLPGIRVLVSGRAPVPGVVLNDRPVRNRHLKGLEPADSAMWLREHGVTDETAIAQLIELSQGVPLNLHLAARWLETGGKLSDIPDEFPKELVQGFLYQRILDRVIDQELKPLAKDILVLRRLTPDMLPAIAKENLPPKVDPAVVFDRLAHEMGLVDGGAAGAIGLPLATASAGGVLQLRPEVRIASLHLLEVADPKRVLTIDRRAARWYAKQDQTDPDNAAELVYHRLRSGDLKGAQAAWRDELAGSLTFVEEELPERAYKARAWIRRHTGPGLGKADVTGSWEQDAAARVRSLLARGMVDKVADVLGEQGDRSLGSPLVVYDAWVRLRAGDPAGARKDLDGEDDGTPTARDRLLLAARVAVAQGDRRTADGHLRRIEGAERWRERPEPDLDALTVTAARVRLTVDLERETRLLQILRLDPDAIRSRGGNQDLPSSDVVLPLLARQIARTGSFESLGERIGIPTIPDEEGRFAGELNRYRVMSSEVLQLGGIPADAVDSPWDARDLDRDLGPLMPPISPPPGSPDIDDARILARDLMVLGWHRWSIASSGLFLNRAVVRVTPAGRIGAQQAAILGSLAVYAGNEWSPFRLWHAVRGPLSRYVTFALEQLTLVDPAPAPTQLDAARSLIEMAGEQIYDAAALSARQAPSPNSSVSQSSMSTGSVTVRDVVAQFASAGPALENLAVFMLTPDPLDTLLRRVLGVPDTITL